MSKMLPLILQVHAQTKNAKSVPLALANCQTELKKLKKLIALDLTLTEVMMFSLLVYNSIEENTNHTVNEKMYLEILIRLNSVKLAIT